MRFLLKTVLVLGILAALAVAGYVAWYVGTPVKMQTVPAEFEIPPGSGFRAAAARIEAAGIRVGRLEFELLARWYGRAKDIKAGSYEIATPVTPLQLLEKLTSGDVTQGEVKFIEGWNIRQVRAALNASADLRHDTAGLADADLLARVGAKEGIRGLFFPDTYLFSKGASDLAVLKRAYAAMQRHLAREWEARDTAAVAWRSPYEALIMASVVEKETGRASERDRIAGVLVNRLRIGMLLQADPTVIYGLGEAFDGNLRKIHLQTDGPYNTYTRTGLPPTPIAMPGLGALRAAMRPASTDALYYVARGDGTSEFSRNLEEHNRAVRKYQLNATRK